MMTIFRTTVTGTAFPVAVTRYPITATSEERLCSGSHFEGVVHHRTEGMGAEA